MRITGEQRVSGRRTVLIALDLEAIVGKPHQRDAGALRAVAEHDASRRHVQRGAALGTRGPHAGEVLLLRGHAPEVRGRARLQSETGPQT